MPPKNKKRNVLMKSSLKAKNSAAGFFVKYSWGLTSLRLIKEHVEQILKDILLLESKVCKLLITMFDTHMHHEMNLSFITACVLASHAVVANQANKASLFQS